MKKIKLILIFTLAALMLINTGILFAQENDTKEKNKDGDRDKKEKIIEVATTTLEIATTSPSQATTTPPETATSSVEATVVIPPRVIEKPRFPFNLFVPERQNAGTTTSTTTPAVVMSTGAGNTNLGNGLFGTNYYASGAFPPAVARSLMLVGFLSGVLGLLLLLKGSMQTTRFY